MRRKDEEARGLENRMVQGGYKRTIKELSVPSSTTCIDTRALPGGSRSASTEKCERQEDKGEERKASNKTRRKEEMGIIGSKMTQLPHKTSPLTSSSHASRTTIGGVPRAAGTPTTRASQFNKGEACIAAALSVICPRRLSETKPTVATIHRIMLRILRHSRPTLRYHSSAYDPE